MTNKINKYFKGDINMISKINYIKRGTKYIIGAGAMIVGLSSAAFGLTLDPDDNFYKIETFEDLIEFAGKVNNGEMT